MTIRRADLKIFKPERLGNEDNAGGFRSGNEVVNGKLNDVFSSISDIDHARSAFDLVKLFPAVNTDDNAKLQDAYVYIDEQPNDPLVTMLLIENSKLTDADKLSDMQLLLTDDTTRFHGMSLAIEEINSDVIVLGETSLQLVPSIAKASSSFNKTGYFFSGTESKSVTKSVEFTASENGDVSFFSLAVDDYLNAYIPWTDYRGLELRWKVTYFSSKHGNIVMYSSQGQFEEQIQFIDGKFEIALTLPLRANAKFTLSYKSTLDYRLHKFAINSVLTLQENEFIVPGSFKIKKAETNEVYSDNGQGLFVDNTQNVFAQINYSTGEITPPESVDYSSNLVEDLGCAIFMSTPENQQYPSTIGFTIPTDANAQIKIDSVYLSFTLNTGTTFSVSADEYGQFEHVNISNGRIDSFGDVSLRMADGINVAKIDYDFDSVESVIAQTDWYGFDATGIANGGSVPVFHRHNVVSITNKALYEEATLTNGQVVSVLAEANYIDIIDSTGVSLYSVTDDNYTYGKETGNVTINATISDFTAPFVITAIQSERALVAELAGNELTLLTPLSRVYPVGSNVASVLILGDLQSRSRHERTTSAWDGDFDKNLDGLGDVASGNINTSQYPIELTNIGTINQKWALVFTSQTSFKVIGENVGIISSGDTLNDLLPSNLLVNAAFFIIRKEAFGGGLNPGEAFIFETVAASDPIMLSRSVSAGHSNITNDQSNLAFFGNSD